MQVSAKVEGGKDLERALLAMPLSTSKRVLTNALKRSAVPLQDTMIIMAPDDPKTAPPWDLKSSIEVGTDASETAKKELPERYSAAVFVGPTRFGYPQAIFTEFGTIKMPAIPWARPSWDSQQPYVLRILIGELWAGIERFAKLNGRGDLIR